MGCAGMGDAVPFTGPSVLPTPRRPVLRVPLACLVALVALPASAQTPPRLIVGAFNVGVGSPYFATSAGAEVQRGFLAYGLRGATGAQIHSSPCSATSDLANDPCRLGTLEAYAGGAVLYGPLRLAANAGPSLNVFRTGAGRWTAAPGLALTAGADVYPFGWPVGLGVQFHTDYNVVWRHERLDIGPRLRLPL